MPAGDGPCIHDHQSAVTAEQVPAGYQEIRDHQIQADHRACHCRLPGQELVQLIHVHIDAHVYHHQ